MIFLFNDPATPGIYTLSLHDALPILHAGWESIFPLLDGHGIAIELLGGLTMGDLRIGRQMLASGGRSEEHTSELQSRENLVCRLLLEKKKYRRSWGMRRTQRSGS